MEKGLKELNRLIENRNFLLIFIRTLENETSFAQKDRVYVASLISVTLQNRLEYYTE